MLFSLALCFCIVEQNGPSNRTPWRGNFFFQIGFGETGIISTDTVQSVIKQIPFVFWEDPISFSFLVFLSSLSLIHVSRTKHNITNILTQYS